MEKFKVNRVEAAVAFLAATALAASGLAGIELMKGVSSEPAGGVSTEYLPDAQPAAPQNIQVIDAPR